MTKSQSTPEMKKIATGLEPLVRIGKAGITDKLIAEVAKHLKTKRLVKVKFLKSGLEEKNIKEQAARLSEGTGAEIISIIGFTVVLFMKRKDYKQS